MRFPSVKKKNVAIANEPYTETSRSQQVEYKYITLASVFCLIVAFLFFVFFFVSDLPSRFVQAKTTYVTSSSPSTPTVSVVPEPVGGTVSHETNDPMTAEQLLLYFQQLSDEDKQKTVSSMFSLASDDVSKALALLIQERQVTSADQLSAIISTLSPSDIQKLVHKSSTMVTVTTPSQVTPISDSKKVAEKKRLKQLADRQATTYLYYVAEDGDTLLRLSSFFNVSLGQLIELNHIADADRIKAGQILVFPSTTKQPKTIQR